MQEGLSAPQVSIVVPVYNVEGYLRRCLNSIWQQTLEAWECICVDDGSPDSELRAENLELRCIGQDKKHSHMLDAHK